MGACRKFSRGHKSEWTDKKAHFRVFCTQTASDVIIFKFLSGGVNIFDMYLTCTSTNTCKRVRGAICASADVTDFSAVCWLFGKRLYERLAIPIGLIKTSYGGTRIEAWSSPKALDVCFPGGVEP